MGDAWRWHRNIRIQSENGGKFLSRNDVRHKTAIRFAHMNGYGDDVVCSVWVYQSSTPRLFALFAQLLLAMLRTGKQFRGKMPLPPSAPTSPTTTLHYDGRWQRHQRWHRIKCKKSFIIHDYDCVVSQRRTSHGPSRSRALEKTKNVHHVFMFVASPPFAIVIITNSSHRFIAMMDSSESIMKFVRKWSTKSIYGTQGMVKHLAIRVYLLVMFDINHYYVSYQPDPATGRKIYCRQCRCTGLVPMLRRNQLENTMRNTIVHDHVNVNLNKSISWYELREMIIIMWMNLSLQNFNWTDYDDDDAPVPGLFSESVEMNAHNVRRNAGDRVEHVSSPLSSAVFCGASLIFIHISHLFGSF